ncbi:ribosome biogenesis protein BOP1 isoform X2 [Chamaea fasciata]|uniref:ribosome biogenesis protein BOP1 isoform X2 n=1 Tax=Chamaea fasciata TaxID=190680 RepID=UPI00336A75C7
MEFLPDFPGTPSHFSPKIPWHPLTLFPVFSPGNGSKISLEFPGIPGSPPHPFSRCFFPFPGHPEHGGEHPHGVVPGFPARGLRPGRPQDLQTAAHQGRAGSLPGEDGKPGILAHGAGRADGGRRPSVRRAAGAGAAPAAGTLRRRQLRPLPALRGFLQPRGADPPGDQPAGRQTELHPLAGGEGKGLQAGARHQDGLDPTPEAQGERSHLLRPLGSGRSQLHPGPAQDARPRSQNPAAGTRRVLQPAPRVPAQPRGGAGAGAAGAVGAAPELPAAELPEPARRARLPALRPRALRALPRPLPLPPPAQDEGQRGSRGSHSQTSQAAGSAALPDHPGPGLPWPFQPGADPERVAQRAVVGVRLRRRHAAVLGGGERALPAHGARGLPLSHHPIVFPSFSRRYPVVSPSFPRRFPVVFPSFPRRLFPRRFPVVFPSFSPRFPVVFPSFSRRLFSRRFPVVFPSFSRRFPVVSRHFPVVFPSFPRRFPVVSPSLSRRFPVVFPSFSRRLFSRRFPAVIPLSFQAPTTARCGSGRWGARAACARCPWAPLIPSSRRFPVVFPSFSRRFPAVIPLSFQAPTTARCGSGRWGARAACARCPWGRRCGAWPGTPTPTSAWWPPPWRIRCCC